MKVRLCPACDIPPDYGSSGGGVSNRIVQPFTGHPYHVTRASSSWTMGPITSEVFVWRVRKVPWMGHFRSSGWRSRVWVMASPLLVFSLSACEASPSRVPEALRKIHDPGGHEFLNPLRPSLRRHRHRSANSVLYGIGSRCRRVPWRARVRQHPVHSSAVISVVLCVLATLRSRRGPDQQRNHREMTAVRSSSMGAGRVTSSPPQESGRALPPPTRATHPAFEKSGCSSACCR